MNTYEDGIRAMQFAVKAHGDQLYGDKPYSYHLQGVAKLVTARNENEENWLTLVCIAWLHDVLEDTAVTYEELHSEFGGTIAEAVLFLTRYKDEDYERYYVQLATELQEST